jgi:hypothetical protein
MQSGTSLTSFPRYFERIGVIGARENLASYPPFGRPRWDESSTLAPLEDKYLIVSMEPRIRVSSVTLKLLSMGTLRSQRTRTLFPFRSDSPRSLTDFFFISRLSLPNALEGAGAIWKPEATNKEAITTRNLNIFATDSICDSLNPYKLIIIH